MTESATLGTGETFLRTERPGTFRAFVTEQFPEEVAATAEALELYGGNGHDAAYQRYLECRTRSWFYRHKETGRVAVVSNACRTRGCPFCAQARAMSIMHNIGPWLKKATRPKHIVLTLLHTDRPLVDQIDHLFHAFRRLRRNKRFAKYILGGIWFAQITHNASTDQWHPHLHLLVEGEYYPRMLLSNDWHAATGTSHNVFVRQIEDTRKATRDAGRYVARPGWFHKLPVWKAVELLDAFAHRRTCATWGTARKADLLKQRPFDKEKWEAIGSYRDLLDLADRWPLAANFLDDFFAGTTPRDALALVHCMNQHHLQTLIGPRSPPKSRTTQDTFDLDFTKDGYKLCLDNQNVA